MAGRRLWSLLMPAATTLVVVAGAACGGSAGDGHEPTPIPTPIDFATPPVPKTGTSAADFLDRCDAAIIKAARGEAELRTAIFQCETPLQWGGALTRYPSVLGDDPESVNVFAVLTDICFRTSDSEFAASRLCQAVIGGRTVTP